MSFAHLHVHSGYSLLDGAIKIPDLVATAKSMGMPAVALTDHGQMFGIKHFYNEAKKQGIKPIIGVETYVAPQGRLTRNKTETRHHLVLLAQNGEGYANLIKLITLANLEGFYFKPRVDMELLRAYNKGIIALSACLQGEIPMAILRKSPQEAKETIERYAQIFDGRFYLELQENQIPEQATVNQALIQYGKDLSLPVVATNDCHYLLKEDYESHDVLLCVQTGKKKRDKERMRMSFNTCYFRSPEEMKELFAYCPEAIEATAEIAKSCDFDFPEKEYHFPKIQAAPGFTLDETMEKQAREGLASFLAIKEKSLPPEEKETFPALRERYEERLAMELSVIREMGFSGYFLIVADFISWAKAHSIPVGPGRGSAAGSLAAFSLGITAVDPIRFDLLFERFLNPERKSMPDIDVDFCAEGRAEVLDYVTEKYGGSEHVAQILTLGQMKARGVIRDVGRTLEISLPEVDALAKLVPMELTITLDRALKEEKRLQKEYDSNPVVKTLIDHARKLENLPRHASIHASGVVIGDKPLMEYLPLFLASKVTDKKEAKSLVATQFDLNGVEEMGLVKFDFLGLKTLTLIKHCLRLLAERGEIIKIEDIDSQDPATYSFLRTGNLNGIFQLEKEGIRKYLRSLQPSRLEDIMSLLALYRPGPLGSGQGAQLVKVKRGLAQPDYLHPKLQEILEETQGVILYQEQVMRIAQILAGFSLGEADEIRRAMGKKKPKEMAKLKPDFISRCVANSIPEATAATIFDQLAKFAEYGFNKSHSAAYALVTYQTAWLKTHYPVEFMAALMTSEQGSQEKIASLIYECRHSNIEVLPPDVNASGYKFTVKDKKILFGLGAIKGLGQGAIETILEARREKPFSDFFDFCRRVSTQKVNKRVIDALIRSGSLDASGGASREKMLASLDAALKFKGPANDALEFNSLFGDDDDGAEGALPWVDAAPLPEPQRLADEKEFLGFYVTGHPLSRYEPATLALGAVSIAKVLALRAKTKVMVCGTVSEIKVKKDKKNRDFAFATLEDETSKVEIILWSRTWTRLQDELTPNKTLVVEGWAEPQDEDSRYGSAKIIVDGLWSLDDDLDRKVKFVLVSLPLKKAPEAAPLFDPATARPHAEGLPRYFLKIDDGEGEAFLRLPASPPLTPAFVSEATALLGDARAFHFTDEPFPADS
ncbi:MAG: DNA polymerase III subunit alpha [Deltaproteobacteria bacterium]|jgi:DNA polymerase-3 subunit alpha|nr:DNA polymerase III subunit alpha [Deltaproteobacteria bacterium]